MVGEHAEKCDAIIKSVIRSDWSVHLDNLDNSYYVTWGGSAKAVASEASETSTTKSTGFSAFGRPLGRLDPADLKQVLVKGMLTYGKYLIFINVEVLTILIQYHCICYRLVVHCSSVCFFCNILHYKISGIVRTL